MSLQGLVYRLFLGVSLFSTAVSLNPDSRLNCVSVQIPKYSELNQAFWKGARENQSLMLGDNHRTTGMDSNGNPFPEPMFDNDYFAAQIPYLRLLGYTDIGLELDSSLQQYVDSYLSGSISAAKLNFQTAHITDSLLYIIDEAHRYGMNVHCIDEYTDRNSYTNGGNPSIDGTDRSQKEFINLQKRIFDNRPDARVAVFIGRWHVNETPCYYSGRGRVETPLGYLLLQYTGDKNFSVILSEDEPHFVDLYWPLE